MAARLRGLGQDNTSTHKFVAYNATNQAWNGSAFEDWADANFSTYGITANRQGTTTRYVGDEPSGMVWYELWLWTGVLATSYPVYESNPDANVVQVNNLPATPSAGRSSRITET